MTMMTPATIPPTFHRSTLLLVLLLLLLNHHQLSAFTAGIRPSAKSRTPLTGTNDDSNNNNEADDNDDDAGKKKGFVSKGVPSYTDNWLLSTHNQAQHDYQTKTNSLQAYNRRLQEEEESIREWQEAFQRNGFADFTPPMSFGLNCLMVGADIELPRNEQKTFWEAKLPWEDEAQADITSLRGTYSAVLDVNDVKGEPMAIAKYAAGELVLAIQKSQQPSSSSHDESSLASSNSAGGISVASKRRKDAAYDCIVDQGLLASVLMLNDNAVRTTTIRELLNEAADSIREHGIYVLTTYDENQLTTDTKELLENFGNEAGFEWEFQLDGISDENQQVSIARRFDTGVMPSVGKSSSTTRRSFFGLDMSSPVQGLAPAQE